MDASERVREAIHATKRGYWKKQLAMRAGLSDQAQGSVVPNVTPEELEALLLAAEWHPYTDKKVMFGCEAFVAYIPGLRGIVHLSTLPEEMQIVLEDPKGTGKVSAIVNGVPGEEVDFTVLITGPEEDRNRKPIPGTRTVWTFHPGEPIQQTTVESSTYCGCRTNVKEARRMGFRWAKVASRGAFAVAQ